MTILIVFNSKEYLTQKLYNIYVLSRELALYVLKKLYFNIPKVILFILA